MKKRISFAAILLVTLALIITSCGRVDSSINSDASEEIEPSSRSSSPDPDSDKGSDADDTGNEPLEILEARLYAYSETDYSGILLDGDEAEYAGHAWISLKFNTLPPDVEDYPEIAPFILINGDPVRVDRLSPGGDVMNIYLDEQSPPEMVLKVMPGLTIESAVLKEGFGQKLIHHEGLKVDIAPYDTKTQTILPRGLYYSAHELDFLVTFSKPMNRKSVETRLEGAQQVKLETEWLDDTRMLAHINGLDYYDTCSFQVAAGQPADSQVYGDKVYSGHQIDNYPAIAFEIRPEKNLKAVSLVNARERVIKTFEQGMLVEALSPDRSKLAMGLITNADDGYLYTSCILDLTSKNPELVMKPYSALHNPPVQREYWTKDSLYASAVRSDILSVKSELTQDLYEWSGLNRYARETLVLDNGDIAMVQIQYVSADESEEEIVMVHATREGEVIHTYDLPFKTKAGEGWIHFECDIEDLGDGRILATGYENPPFGPVSTYEINLADQSVSLVVQTGDLIQRFPELGFSLYYGLSEGKNNDSKTVCIINFSGKQLKEITLPEDWHLSRAMVNPADKRLYLFANGYEAELLWKSYDTEGFKEKEGSRKMSVYSDPIGFLDSGELLVLESPD